LTCVARCSPDFAPLVVRVTTENPISKR
jgi:hypothetical protein